MTTTPDALKLARDALADLIGACKQAKVDLTAGIRDGDPVHPVSAALTWPLATAINALAAIDALPASVPAWPCHCDDRGIGQPGVTCGDCPKDYWHTVTQASAPGGEPHPLTLLQAGLNNAELLAQWRKKLPGVEPTDRELSAFAVGTEVGWQRARDLERQDWDRVHHVLAKHGKHPGRTDDHLADVIDRALADAHPSPAQREPLSDDPWRKLYRRAINEANGLTNYVEDRPDLRSAERRISAIEAEARTLADSGTTSGTKGAARTEDTAPAAVERVVRPGAEARWYCVDAKGMAQLCADEADARWEVADNTKVFPKNAPYGAVQLIDVAAWADSERSVREHRERLRAALSDLVSRYDQRLPLRERPELWDAARAALKA